MQVAEGDVYCPKCDNKIDAQTDGSTLSVDIAHNGERLREAMQKMERTISEALKGNAQYLRLIVGSGVIREEVLLHLVTLERRKTIVSYSEDGSNQGAVLVRLK